MKLKRIIQSTTGLLILVPGMLFAHHPTGGNMPATFAEGLLSGFAHPVIGLDHFAFVVAVGLLALLLSRSFVLPAFFVGGTLAGTGIHLAAMNLPLVELTIALSVVAGGILLMMQNVSLKSFFYMGLFAFVGIFHGYAYGEAIVGAEATPLVAYLAGFALVQYLVAIGAMLLAAKIPAWTEQSQPAVLRIGGGIIAGVGLVFVSNQVLAALGLA